MVNINSSKPLFHLNSVLVNKYSGSCNDVNNPYGKLCFPDVVKNMNINEFNPLSKTDETRYVSGHETCTCMCRLGKSVCNDRQRWNSDKCINADVNLKN